MQTVFRPLSPGAANVVGDLNSLKSVGSCGCAGCDTDGAAGSEEDVGWGVEAMENDDCSELAEILRYIR